MSLLLDSMLSGAAISKVSASILRFQPPFPLSLERIFITMAQCSIHSEMFAKDTEMPLQSQDDGKAAAWTSAAAVSQNSLPLPVDADKRSSQSLSRTEVGELQLTSATDFTPSAHIGDLTEKQAVPDGGLRAWLQVLSAFCIWFNTW